MARKAAIKVVDDQTFIRCAAGPGTIREEVWREAQGGVVKFNLAFICHHLFNGDNGRVLGYDTAHGYTHRHYCGEAEELSLSYTEIVARFYDEVEELREKERL